jgi:hypothetical protein
MNDVSIEALFPYVIPAGYVDWTEPGMWDSWTFSPEVHLGLAFHRNNMIRSARPAELAALGLDSDAAFDRASENLTREMSADNVGVQGVLGLRDGLDIVVSQGSWMAPAVGLLVREFYEFAAANLRSKVLGAIVVHQQLLVVFPLTEAAARSVALRKFVDDEYKAARKPVSRSWLTLDGGWPQPLEGLQPF